MAAETKIEWCHHTWSPWIGCTRISAACDHCYAAAMSHRRGWATFEAGAPRHRTSAEYWKQPRRWNKRAAANGVRESVFPSLCDPFDAEVGDAWRDDLLAEAEATPALDWLLLTKRPQVAAKYFTVGTGGRKLPHNVWLGTTAENQKMADLRIPTLLSIAGKRAFVSIEPLLGPVDLANLDYGGWQFDALRGISHHTTTTYFDGLAWVIVGGESGPKARPMHPAWVRALRDQCLAAGVPFFFKQWGEHHPSADHDPKTCPAGNRTPEAIHVSGEREFRPSEQFRLISSRADGWAGMCKVGKTNAGAMLDGVEWRQFPAAMRQGQLL